MFTVLITICTQQSMGFDYGASFAQNGGQNQWAATPPSSSPFYDGGFGAVQGQMSHEQFGMPLPPSSSSPMTTPGVVANIWLQQLQQQPQGHYSISQSPQQHGAGYHLPSPQMPPQQQPQAIKQHMPQRSPSVSMPLQHQLQHQQFVGQPQQYGQSHQQQLRQSPVQPACMRHKPVPSPEQPKPIELPQPQEQPQSHFEPVAPAPEQVQFVNLQDIQRMPMPVMPASAPAPVPAPVPAPAPPAMPDTNPPPMSNSVSSSTTTPSLQPAPVIKPSPSSTPHMSTIPSIKSDPSRVQKAQPKSASQSPAVSSSRLPSRSPAVSTKQTPLNTCFMMVTLAEEFIEKARAAVPAVAASLQPGQVDEYQKLIGTGLACLEGALQSQGLPPRQEARVRLRYAAVLQEETENIMEAETTLSKGITLCDKVRLSTLGMTFLRPPPLHCQR
ncbi:protein KRI1 [Geosmithia morbida]|uniref:Protein KRI1 n=1 Tax=Geosmithia morbida TaxID=1094350 RepID=A0A9P4YPT3_9HYPO|nr:protein KRI1 [Geosmithia morbida]KAF4120510.1 protein KRI1 [Geosmithia morbida]